jgi:sec-independent protein translocase protein TatB
MFGLTVEKLFLVAIVAGVLIGPQRLPLYAHELARLVRSSRSALETARARAETDAGVPLRSSEWDLTQYDPRRIVREALQDPPAPRDEAAEQALRVRPGQTHVVTGSAAHPRRVRVDALAVDDPRRIAAAAAGERRLPDAQPGTPAS